MTYTRVQNPTTPPTNEPNNSCGWVFPSVFLGVQEEGGLNHGSGAASATCRGESVGALIGASAGGAAGDAPGPPARTSEGGVPGLSSLWSSNFGEAGSGAFSASIGGFTFSVSSSSPSTLFGGDGGLRLRHGAGMGGGGLSERCMRGLTTWLSTWPHC
eukprot:Hpha_TRINITY_DN15597_c4_g10::TRINITY_DN15597_c4_g10_i1::g.108439::m.108439